MENYDHKKIETKWRKKWEEEKVYKTTEDPKKPKSYILDMFPYPSGAGLHVGHPKGYIATDVYSRQKRMAGYNVLHPMGWDAFGLPAENYAIKNKVHPRVAVEENVARFKEQLANIGFDYDWGREINTTDPEYYKWTQWIFLKLLEKGLAYESYEPINWCPSCQTGLANEDLESDGTCERCDSVVEKRPMRQWVLKITDYADRMLEDLETLDWPEHIKEMQRNWIGRSAGAKLKFQITNSKNQINSKSQAPNVVIVHGSNATEESSKEGEPENLRHWKPWLKKNLEAKGFEVSNELYPEDWLPDYEAWKKVFEKNKINEHTTLVGHSAGTAFILRWLGETKTRVNKVILVAPSIMKSKKYKNSTFKDFEIDPMLSERVNEMFVFYSTDDPFEGIGESVKKLRELFEPEYFEYEDRGHFLKRDMATEEFPELLDAILHESATSTAVEVFTTRPDTLFGATYMVLSPEHPFVLKQIRNSKSDLSTDVGIRNKSEIENYIQEAQNKSEIERTDATKEKTGVELKGVKAINPATKEEIPVWIADYVLAGYGTGAIMAVPAHDERDHEFAKKFDLPIRQVTAMQTGEKRDNEEIRSGGCAVVFDPESQKYAVCDHKSGLLRLCSGGVDEGEDLHEGILREVEEESGLHNFDHVEEISRAYVRYYNSIKDVNRAGWATCLYVSLKNNETKELALDDHEDFELKWVSAKELLDNWLGSGRGSDVEHWVMFLKQAVNRAVELGHDTTSDLGDFEHGIYTGYGKLVNSGEFDGMESKGAIEAITKKFGEKAVTYRLADWVFSRQRYWGEPIPIMYCRSCWEAQSSKLKAKSLRKNIDYTVIDGVEYMIVPVPEEDLPVLLPEVESYEPTGTGESPLASIDEWVNTTCPTCGGEAKRETNTMPQWAGSSWYWLRYIDPRNDKALVDPEKEKYWGPVDVYVGGDHAVRHLIYARFWHKFLYDIGSVHTIEPFSRLEFLGFILAEDGRKMSKRWGNVINPDDIVEKVGADTLRVYEMFMGPFENDIAWSTDGMVGARRFLERVVRMEASVQEKKVPEVESVLHKTTQKVGEDIEKFKFNTAVSQMMICLNAFEGAGAVGKAQWKMFLQILAPFAPHLTDELWEKAGEKTSIHVSEWPTYDEKLVKDEVVTIAIQVNGKVRASIEVPTDAPEEEVQKQALAESTIQKWVGGADIKKVIFVPNKILNLVI